MRFMVYALKKIVFVCGYTIFNDHFQALRIKCKDIECVLPGNAFRTLTNQGPGFSRDVWMVSLLIHGNANIFYFRDRSMKEKSLDQNSWDLFHFDILDRASSYCRWWTCASELAKGQEKEAPPSLSSVNTMGPLLNTRQMLAVYVALDHVKFYFIVINCVYF